jgi:phosphoribosylamine--glycine ligase
MRILVIGSGGREHAICDAFARSNRVSKLFCAPGNAGIAQIAKCVPIKPEDLSGLAEFAAHEQIDLTFVGGETPVALGVVDEFEKRGLKIIGASKKAAQLEASKSFAKDFMTRHAIPTAKFHTAHSPQEAIEILQSGHFGEASAPVVVKADGLAAGKGVVVARDRAEAIRACDELAALVGADAAEKIVLEEFLEGREVSLLMFAAGKDFVLMPPVRDHKRIGEGDTGPNTGGMGTITDARLLSPEETQLIIKEIIEPTLNGCIEEGFPFRGILFLGLMMVGESVSPIIRADDEQDIYVVATPKLLEYNVRFGDP